MERGCGQRHVSSKKSFFRLDLDLTIENAELFSVFLLVVASIRKEC
jgi:hypothetical protein